MKNRLILIAVLLGIPAIVIVILRIADDYEKSPVPNPPSLTDELASIAVAGSDLSLHVVPNGAESSVGSDGRNPACIEAGDSYKRGSYRLVLVRNGEELSSADLPGRRDGQSSFLANSETKIFDSVKIKGEYFITLNQLTDCSGANKEVSSSVIKIRDEGAIAILGFKRFDGSGPDVMPRMTFENSSAVSCHNATPYQAKFCEKFRLTDNGFVQEKGYIEKTDRKDSPLVQESRYAAFRFVEAITSKDMDRAKHYVVYKNTRPENEAAFLASYCKDACYQTKVHLADSSHFSDGSYSGIIFTHPDLPPLKVIKADAEYKVLLNAKN